MALKLQFTNGFYQSKSLPLSNQQCLNLYPSVLETGGGLNEESLFQLPGILSVNESTIEGPNRGSELMGVIPYFVNENTLYRLNSDETKTSLGSIVGSGLVSIATNGTQLVIVVPGTGNGYVYTVAGGLVSIVDVYFTANGNPNVVEYVDGRFVFVTDGDKIIQSDINDATSGSAGIFGSAEYEPDSIVGMAVVNNQLHIIGTLTIEALRNIGGTGFVYQRTGVFLDKGAVGKFAIVSSNGTFFMVGKGKNESPAVFAYENNRLNKISHPGIDNILTGFSADELSEIFGYSWSWDGNYFISFALPDQTITYNLNNNRWFEQKSLIGEDVERWRVNSIVEAYGKTYVGDSFDGRIGSFDLDTYTEYDETIIKDFTCQIFDSSGRPFSINKVSLTIESGAGPSLTTDQIRIEDDIPRDFTALAGSPIINGDIISFSTANQTVIDDDYWVGGQTYYVKCIVSNHNGSGSVALPYEIGGSTVQTAFADGTYYYEYTITSVADGVQTDMLINSPASNSCVVEVVYIVNSVGKIIEPRCSMRVSKDGKKFGQPIYRGMGLEGESEKQLNWRSISGFERFGTFKFSLPDSVKTSVLKLEVE